MASDVDAPSGPHFVSGSRLPPSRCRWWRPDVAVRRIRRRTRPLQRGGSPSHRAWIRNTAAAAAGSTRRRTSPPCRALPGTTCRTCWNASARRRPPCPPSAGTGWPTSSPPSTAGRARPLVEDRVLLARPATRAMRYGPLSGDVLPQVSVPAGGSGHITMGMSRPVNRPPGNDLRASRKEAPGADSERRP